MEFIEFIDFIEFMEFIEFIESFDLGAMKCKEKSYRHCGLR
jgi:hypothetical protein